MSGTAPESSVPARQLIASAADCEPAEIVVTADGRATLVRTDGGQGVGGAWPRGLAGWRPCLHPAWGPWLAAVCWCRVGFWGGLGGRAVGGWPPVPAAEQGDGGGGEQGADKEGVHEDADRDG